jgi:type II secretory pathway component GspD/PulD (secretin)
MKTHRKWGWCALIGSGLMVLVIAVVGNLDASQGQRKQSFQLQCQSVKLEHADCERVANRVRKLFEHDKGNLHKISWYNPTNVVLLRATPDDIEQMKFLISQIDIPQEPKESAEVPTRLFQVIPVQQSDAGSLARLLHSMFDSMVEEQNGGRVRPAHFEVDDRTNTIVMYGTHRQINQAKELITTLDVSIEP